MYTDTISLENALELQESGKITIIDASPMYVPAVEHQDGKLWKSNFKHLYLKHRHISPGKLLTFLNSRFLIEVKVSTESDPDSLIWRYLHGIENSEEVLQNGEKG